MGAAASIPERVDETKAKELLEGCAAGKWESEGKTEFKSRVDEQDNCISREVALELKEKLVPGSTAEEDSAALKIQSVQRGKKARKEVAEKKKSNQAAEATDAPEETASANGGAAEEGAALKIQSVQRGKQARAEVNDKKRKIQEEAEVASATKIQKVQRGKQARKSLNADAAKESEK